MLELAIEARSSKFAADNDGWRDQAQTLYVGLGQAGAGVRVESRTSPGKKGDVSSVIVALGSAGAFAATLDFFKAWLSRDRSRSVLITYTLPDGRSQTLTVDADADSTTFHELAILAAQRFPDE